MEQTQPKLVPEKRWGKHVIRINPNLVQNIGSKLCSEQVVREFELGPLDTKRTTQSPCPTCSDFVLFFFIFAHRWRGLD